MYYLFQESCRGYLFVGYQRNRIEVFELSQMGGGQPKLCKEISVTNKQCAPCRNMLLLADNTELWFSCGNTVVVASLGGASDELSKDVIQELVVDVDTTSIITSMKYHSGFVWYSVMNCYLGFTCQMVKIDVSNRKCVGRLEVKGNEVVGDNIGVDSGEGRLEAQADVRGIGAGDTEGEIEDNSNPSYVLCFQVSDSILWLGTSKGTVVVVDTSESNFGKVIGIFSLGNIISATRRSFVGGDTDSPVKHLSLTGNGKLIACQEITGDEVLERPISSCSHYEVIEIHSNESSGEATRQFAKDEIDGPVWHSAVIEHQISLASQEFKGNTSGKTVLGERISVGSKYRLAIWDRWTLDRFCWFEKVKQPLTL